MNPVEEIKEDIEKKDKSKILTFLFFVVISTILWFLIKLTKDYSTQTVFIVHYTEVPSNKWVSTQEQTVKLTFSADGFVTLGHNLVRNKHRVVDIPLNEVPYRLEGGVTYSYSSQYVAEKVAEWLNIPSSNIIVNEDKQFFNMEDLQSKVLPIHIPLEVKTQRQYRVYGTPVTTPETITVYGPKNTLDTLTSIFTEPLVADNVNEDLRKTLKINLYGGSIQSDTKIAEAFVDIEKYTEQELEVPVSITDSLAVRFFPETMTVKCMVAIKDYGALAPSSFLVLADTAQLHQREPLLDIKLSKIPDHIQVVSTKPDQVEYLIIN